MWLVLTLTRFVQLLCGFYVWYVAIAAAEGDVWGLVLFIGSIIVCVTIGIIGKEKGHDIIPL